MEMVPITPDAYDRSMWFVWELVPGRGFSCTAGGVGAVAWVQVLIRLHPFCYQFYRAILRALSSFARKISTLIGYAAGWRRTFSNLFNPLAVSIVCDVICRVPSARQRLSKIVRGTFPRPSGYRVGSFCPGFV